MLRHRPRSKFNSTFVLGASGWMSSRLSGAVRAELGVVALAKSLRWLRGLSFSPLRRSSVVVISEPKVTIEPQAISFDHLGLMSNLFYEDASNGSSSTLSSPY